MQEMTAPSPTSPPSLLNPLQNLGSASHPLTHLSMLVTRCYGTGTRTGTGTAGKELFIVAEPEPACIPDLVPVPDLDPDPIKNGKKNKKIKKLIRTFWETMLVIKLKARIFLKFSI
jgi:hypothetical protein